MSSMARRSSRSRWLSMRAPKIIVLTSNPLPHLVNRLSDDSVGTSHTRSARRDRTCRKPKQPTPSLSSRPSIQNRPAPSILTYGASTFPASQWRFDQM